MRYSHLSAPVGNKRWGCILAGARTITRSTRDDVTWKTRSRYIILMYSIYPLYPVYDIPDILDLLSFKIIVANFKIVSHFYPSFRPIFSLRIFIINSYRTFSTTNKIQSNSPFVSTRLLMRFLQSNGFIGISPSLGFITLEIPEQ